VACPLLVAARVAWALLVAAMRVHCLKLQCVSIACSCKGVAWACPFTGRVVGRGTGTSIDILTQFMVLCEHNHVREVDGDVPWLMASTLQSPACTYRFAVSFLCIHISYLQPPALTHMFTVCCFCALHVPKHRSKHACACRHACAPTQADAHTHAHTHTHSFTHSLTHIHTQHARTITYSYAPSLVRK
jgi:hypothetical protein